MYSRVFVWLLAAFALGDTLALERVILQLPLVPRDKGSFSVDKHAIKAEYLEYSITSKRKSQIIREVKFADFHLFQVTDDCDRKIVDRVVTVTLTAHGIFVQVASNTVHSTWLDHYKVGKDTFYEFVSSSDYARFVRPLSNKDILGIALFPYTMVSFVPVFDRRLRETRYYICNEYIFRDAIEKEKILLAAQGGKSKYIIQSVDAVQRLTFPIPTTRALNETKQLYKAFRIDNVSQGRLSKFIPVNTRALSDDPICATPSEATIYYMTALGRPVIGYKWQKQ